MPSTSTISRDEFLEATTDLWEIPPDSATRVGHPAPFPVELPRRLIDLFTYEGDVVLDPFMGSGTTAVAAVRSGRRFIGFDTDASYVARAKKRVKAERDRLGRLQDPFSTRVQIRAASHEVDGEGAVARGLRNGLQAKELAGILLEDCGFVDVRPDVKLPGLGLEVHFTATDDTGAEWAFDVSGAFTSNRSGLKRAETLLAAPRQSDRAPPGPARSATRLVTTDRPNKGSAGHVSLDTVTELGRPVFDLVELLDVGGHERLRRYATGGRTEI